MCVCVVCVLCVVFFQAEDGIRDLVRSRGLGDVYKRQGQAWAMVIDASSGRMYATITGRDGAIVMIGSCTPA